MYVEMQLKVVFSIINKATTHVTGTGGGEGFNIILPSRLLIGLQGHPEGPTTRLLNFLPPSIKF